MVDDNGNSGQTTNDKNVVKALLGAVRSLRGGKIADLQNHLIQELNRLHKEGVSIDEWRFQELKSVDEWRFADMKTADEWRFQDMKSHINDKVSQDTQFALEQSVKEIAKLGDSRQMAVAVVSIFPPADSGIATFTEKTFAASGRTVDIYTPINSGFEYLAMRMQTRRAEISNVFSANALPAGLEQRNYFAVVFVVGNSDHFVPIARLLRTLRNYPRPTHYALEIHDPVLLNLCAKVSLTRGLRLSDVLPNHSAENLTGIDWRKADAGDHQELVDLGVGGVRALFNDAPISSIIVHSNAARDLVLRDWRDFPREKINVLYHPVFEAFNEQRAIDAPAGKTAINIGTFGVPGPGKESDTIVEAFRMVAEDRPGSTLVIAGFDADNYVANNEALRGRRDVIVHDGPAHDRLLELMGKCDIAVQLRTQNTGESSGVVPQLMACDVPTICSRIGSFEDFGEAVAFVEPGCTAEALARTLIAEAENPAKRRALRKSLVLDRSPRHFCEELYAYVDLLEGRDPAGASAKEDVLAKTAPRVAEAADDGQATAWNEHEPQPKSWPQFLQVVDEIGANKDSYIQGHLLRYRHTLAAIEALALPEGAAGLEVGTSWLFAPVLRNAFGFNRVDVTNFDPHDSRKIVPTTLPISGPGQTFSAFNINLEQELFPAEDETYDFVLCCEVLEHMDVDPMFMMCEINRICRPGARLLLTTPNVCSSLNVQKILLGYAPHFYMQYHKDRSPYRHNLEYAPDQVGGVIAAAGFEVEQHWTVNTFDKPSLDTLSFLRKQGFPTHMRGDNQFVVARKSGPVVDRYPGVVYV